MIGSSKRMWIGAGALILFGAAALAITAPRDTTVFVSARPPAAVKKLASSASQAQVGTVRVATVGPATAATPVDRAVNTRALVESVATESGSTARQPGAALAQRNLFRPLVGIGLPPSSLPPMPMFDGMLPWADADMLGGKRQRAYWEYVGTVKLGGVTYALIEEKKSKAGVYLKAGDAFQGGSVQVVRSEYVTISLAGREYTLPKSTGMAESAVETAAQPVGSRSPNAVLDGGNPPEQAEALAAAGAPAGGVGGDSRPRSGRWRWQRSGRAEAGAN